MVRYLSRQHDIGRASEFRDYCKLFEVALLSLNYAFLERYAEISVSKSGCLTWKIVTRWLSVQFLLASMQRTKTLICHF